METKLFSILVRSGVTLLFAISFTLSAAVPQQSRSLSFADRVAYQRAIENVYWQHRIWPKERPDPKPSLDAVMSQAQLEKKVTQYLRNSQALENDWQRPMTADQLQAEMDRMAQHSKQPAVLRELFAALNNDPFIIAECLARPALAERTLATVESLKEPMRPRLAKAQMRVAVTIAVISANYALPIIDSPSGGCTDDTWTPTSTANAPVGRWLHTAVWTGTEMIVWGGFTSVNTGGRYNPSTDSWIATSTTNAPEGRYNHTAVWTGTEMIIWGGTLYDEASNTGGRYNPITDTWTATSAADAPERRTSHTAVWTGSEMIV
jgi:hypothetical protein